MLTAFPDARSLLPALKKLDVLATSEILPNETTALSTHVLPTKDQLERPDVTLWDILSPRVSAQHTPAVVEPVGERRSMWWVLAELGRRLGHELADTTATERLGGWRLAPRLLLDQLAAVRTPPPLALVPRRQMRRLNSQLEFLGEAVEVMIHPDDAAAAGVSDGRPLVVRSAHGELTGIAKLNPSIRRGAVSVPHGHAGANVNLLTSKDDIDLVTGMTRYSGVPVTLHPA
jgi:anaerobic selenocysteine-containing dehydrogenase